MKVQNCMRIVLILMFCSFAGEMFVFTESRNPEHTLRLDPSAPRPTARIHDVAFIAGHWTGEAFGGTAEEVWTQPLGSSMMGMYKMVKDGKVAFYELLSIMEEEGGLTLKLKHFNPDLTGWEEKNSVLSFPLVKSSPNEVFFDGMTFRKLGDGSLQIYLLIEDKKSGKSTEHEFLYKPALKQQEAVKMK